MPERGKKTTSSNKATKAKAKEVEEVKAKERVVEDAPEIQEKPKEKPTTKKEVVESIVNKDANEKLKKAIEERDALQEQLKQKVEVAQVQKSGVKLVKVRFIKKHTFNIGINKVVAEENSVHSVEPHLANKFVARRIAYILG